MHGICNHDLFDIVKLFEQSRQTPDNVRGEYKSGRFSFGEVSPDYLLKIIAPNYASRTMLS